VFYTLDGGSRAYLGRANNSPRSTIWFTGVNGNFVTGHDIEISIESYTTSPAVSPVYYEIIVRGALRPKSVDEISAVVRIADNMHDRRGGPMRSAAQMCRELRGMAATTNPVFMTDLSGAGSWVLVRPSITETEAYQPGQEHPETQLTVQMAVLDFTTNQGTSWSDVSDMTWSQASAFTWAQLANM